MMKRVVAAAIMATGLFATADAYATTEIQWWHAMGGRNTDKINEIAAKYNASQNKYKVIPSYKGNYTETMTGAIAAFRAKKQPHIVQVFEVGTATMMAAKGAIVPVYKLMADTHTKFDPSAYLPAVKSYYTTTDGKMLSMPFNSSTPVLWYNKDAFKKAGLDPNQPPKTWDEMFDTSRKLVKSGMKCGFTVGWQSWVMIENFNAWHNQSIGTKANGFGGLDTKLNFNHPETSALLQRIADSQKEHLFVYGGRRSDSLAKFTNGECGMWMTSSASLSGIKKSAKFDFGQSMLPLDTKIAKTPQNSIIGGASLWVLNGHDKKDYAGVADFFKFLSSPAIQYDWHSFTGYVPITTAAYKLAKKDGHYKRNPGADTAIRQLSLNPPTANSSGLRFGNFVQIRDVINEEMEALWSGKKTAKQALDAAIKRGNVLLRKFEKANR